MGGETARSAPRMKMTTDNPLEELLPEDRDFTVPSAEESIIAMLEKEVSSLRQENVYLKAEIYDLATRMAKEGVI
jgi:hypothetical protein